MLTNGIEKVDLPPNPCYFTTIMTEEMNYRKLRKTDRESVETLLYTSFIVEDPLEVALGIECPREARILVEPVVALALEDGVSLVAEHYPSGELVGVCLNTIDTDTGGCVSVPTDDPCCAKMGILLDFFQSMREGTKMCSGPSLEKVLNIRIINVTNKFSRKGIGRTLVQRSLSLAEEQGCSAAFADATGLFSQKMFAALEFTTIKEVFYTDYTKDGSHVFQNTGIHKSCRFVALTL